MSKRSANNVLTHDNWNDEEEVEDPGQFSVASTEELSTRRIKTAHRRGHNTSSSSPAGALFSGFKGFSGSATTNPSGPTMLTSAAPNLSNGFKSTQALQQSVAASEPSRTVLPPGDTASKNELTSDRSPDFLTALAKLNTQCLAFAQQRVQANPYIDLCPVFQDYMKHFYRLEERYPAKSEASLLPPTFFGSVVLPQQQQQPSVNTKETTSASVTSSVGFEPAMSKVAVGTGLFGGQDSSKIQPVKTNKIESEVPKSSTFVGFGASQTTTPTTLATTNSTVPQPGFFFGKPSTTAAPSFGLTPFSTNAPLFGVGDSSKTATGFLFGNVAPVAKPAALVSGTEESGGQDAEGADDAEYQPPKVENVEIEEEGAVYTQKCKLFFNKDGNYVEKGVGSLYLKTTDGGKTQLLIRAGTSLGNVLLNILLTKSIPCSKVGKNNVSIACVPNPPLDPKQPDDQRKPVGMLIRVRTAEDADELLKKLEQYKTAE